MILADESETITKSGIIIPDTAKEKPLRGTVISVGPGNDREHLELKRGSIVMYNKYAGTPLNLEGTDYLIMRQSDVLLEITE